VSPTRQITILLLWGMLLGLLVLDALHSLPIDRFQLPPPLAWGSGSLASGGFCAVSPQ
jgi:hypothetical protein